MPPAANSETASDGAESENLPGASVSAERNQFERIRQDPQVAELIRLFGADIVKLEDLKTPD